MPDAQRAEIAKLEALHAEHPQGRIFTHLAEAYRKAGELDRAREVLSLGIDLHPDYSSAHVVLARVLRDQGEEEGAIAAFHRVLDLDAQNLVALRALGDIARDAGHMTEAQDYYRRLLDIEPSDSDVRERLEELERDQAPATGHLPEEEPAAPAVEHFEEPAPADDATGSALEGMETFDVSDFETTSLDPDAGRADTAEPASDEPAADSGLDIESFDSFQIDGGEEAGPPAGAEPLPSLDEEAGAAALPSLDDEGGTALPSFEDEIDAGPLPSLDTPEEPGPLPGLPSLDGDEDTGWVEGGAAEEAEAFPEAAWTGEEGGAEGAGEDEPPLPAGDSGEPGVHTETIAQIYARQGLYDRAAEVYRQLLRQRPDDPALRARLDEMEGLAEMPSPGEVEPLPGLETSELESPGEVAPLAGLESDEIDPSTGLRPTDSVPALEGLPEATVRDVPAPPEEESPALRADLEPELEPDLGPEVAPESEVAPEPEIGPEPVLAPEPELGPEPTREAEAEAEAEAVESVWTGAAGASGGEESPYAWAAESESEPDESPPIGSYFQSLLGWGGAGPVAGNVGGPGGDEGAAPSDAGAEPAGAEPAGGGEEDRSDDDDLDTFRSWLESLKQ